MDTASHAAVRAGRLSHPDTRQAFSKMKKFVIVYGALGLAVFTVVVLLSINGDKVSSFMWGRASGVFASAVVTYWLIGLAARGSRAAYIRVRIISVVVPIAIVVIDSIILGALPAWFIAMQVVGALVLLPTAFIINRSELRAAFAKQAR